MVIVTSLSYCSALNEYVMGLQLQYHLTPNIRLQLQCFYMDHVRVLYSVSCYNVQMYQLCFYNILDFITSFVLIG